MKKINTAALFAMFMTGSLLTSAQTLSSRQDEKTGLYGLTDEQGNYVVKPVYKEVGSFSGNQSGLRKVVNKKDKVGFINEQGKEVVPCKYDEAGSFESFGSFEDGYIIVKIKSGDDYKIGLMDSTGKEVVAVKYGRMKYYPKDKVLVVGETNMSDVGLMALNGKWMIPPQYSFISGKVTKGIWPVQNNKYKYGVVNLKNDVIVPFEYSLIGDYSEDLDIAFASKEKTGFIDRTGKVIIPFMYDAVTMFDHNYLVVEQDKKSGIIDLNNKIILPFEYAGVSSIDIKAHTALVSKTENGETYEIDLITKQKVKK